MSILQLKQQQQGAVQIEKRVAQLLQAQGREVVTITWDLGKLDPKLDNHTLNVLVENGIVKESFTSKELEDSYSRLRPTVEDCLNSMISRLEAQIKGN
ncbi:MAG: hypothetical protein OEX12_08585 [Gammaproteobacteria bacterium]|nr:hypothetical protein [Gammaproteobacteria bacterium]